MSYFVALSNHERCIDSKAQKSSRTQVIKNDRIIPTTFFILKQNKTKQKAANRKSQRPQPRNRTRTDEERMAPMLLFFFFFFR